MWKIEKRFRFEASHRLPHHDGKCARLHGHSWHASIICEGQTLAEHGPKQAMLLDYADLSKAAENLCDKYLDHYHLNDSTGLESPTSEALARWIYDMLKPNLPLLTAVVIEETCSSRCEYRPNK
ncbi:MAG: 6-carboxytetrahydropterin synthase QueD [Oligoflexia bacterium]|nr:6-carboxytetrahydropterin synthase QueD [Oligoflexia bacterium]